MSPSKIVTTDLAPDPDSIPDADSVHENEWYNQDFDNYRVTEQPLFTKRHIRLVCVGAGATGLEVAYKAERFLQDVEIQIYEKNSDIGGTWLENRYPGCTCDIPSHSYQFPWARNPNWTQFYSGSEEIWRYFKSVAVKFGLEKYVKFEHKLKTAKWNEECGVWDLTVQAPDGSEFLDHCEILVNGSGVLNSWKYPNIQGLDTFKGKLMHSASWENDVDFRGKTVAVIGGGSSAVQIIPSLQPDVKKLIPFLRSPVWITTGFGAKFAGPGGTNFTYSDEQKKTFNEDPEHYNQYCRNLEGELNKRFTLMHLKSKDQASSRNLVASIMNEQLNNDTRLVKHLVPQFALGCRRMTPGSGYLQSLTKSNVDVITQDVVRLTEDGVVDASGTEHKVDIVVCATGFDTTFTPHFECIGRGGKSLKEQFGDFPKGYLGIMAENFPNLFLLIGPNGPASHASLLPVLEWHTRYMFQMVTKLQEENIKCFDPTKEAIHDFYNHTHELMKRLVWSSACRSWFKNGKTHGPVTAIWPGSRLHYFEVLKKVRYEDFNITYRSNNRFQFMGNGYTETEIDQDGNPVWYFDDPFVRT